MVFPAVRRRIRRPAAGRTTLVNKRLDITVTGCVQGVGFRPFVYRLATALELAGTVCNTPAGVRIDVEGEASQVDAFFVRLREDAPPQARIDSLAARELPPQGGLPGVRILASGRSGDIVAGMPPDLATCADCRRELFDPADRRFGHPFVNCTNCGPRFTIIGGLPYDRERTAMAGFSMCPRCRAEYGNPADRRFEAQPVACPECGPRLRFLASPADAAGIGDVGTDPVAEFAQRLLAGGIGAMKGIGGFLLVCLAADDAAVRRLRERKHRPHKPLAVMFRDLDQIQAGCEISAAEEAWLTSPAAPIVILKPKPAPAGGTEECLLSPLISPDTGEIGAFLPYTPLHHLLLTLASPLIMTSANRAEEPIASSLEELRDRSLFGPEGGVADFVLDHDRPILRRCDDSVLMVAASGAPVLLRRSRGFVPAPVALPVSGPPVLACGGDVKNVFVVTRGGQAFLSQHIGDLEEPSAFEFLRTASADLAGLLGVVPELIACDLHPGYFSSRFGRMQGAQAKGGVHFIQHHHAHIAAVLAEHGESGPVLGLALDGTGYGPDGTVWGGELLVANLAEYRRAACLEPVPMPGGEAAVHEPDRMALSWLRAAFGPEEAARLAAKILPGVSAERVRLLLMLCGDRALAPLTSSAGRLFDAAGALLGFAAPVTYEGQAAIRLQALAESGPVVCGSVACGGERETTELGDPRGRFPGDFIDSGDFCDAKIPNPKSKIQNFQLAPAVIAVSPLIRELVAGALAGRDRGGLARRFHETLAELWTSACCGVRGETGLNTAALSGGVFQNQLFLERMSRGLEDAGFRVLTHRQTSPNDSCLAMGQAAAVLAAWQLGRK